MTVLDSLKNMLQGMPQTESRVNLIAARGQSNLKEGVNNSKTKILEKRTGTARGKYKPRRRWDNNTKVVTSVVEVVEYEDELYVRLTNGTLIPQRWLAIYEWFVGKEAPKE